ncbi:hypothetical protein N7492_006699 [Penicillium capsulatum]|uniref:Palmitoyl-protein thioesterase 1 n=1 Tax=Penicillium capsulatum TaxID=69766 RepID=A0A9W9I187_9EURO|nr:hypothetical protein N7492_006699 [Penicillium capsulatum]KAJ6116535.1 hypothetical protein N7512_006260 [Penicillium capsulatum]
MRFLHVLVALAAPAISASISWNDELADTPTQLPLVIWHGLGDDFEREGLQGVASLAETTNPGTHVHLIRLADTGGSDRTATFFGNVTEQIQLVCEQIAADPILGQAPGINALGFSQGGQFLRGYIERCNSPPVHNLVTFGSQHNGISEFQSCKPGDWVCNSIEGLLRAGRWSDLVQSQVVPAQYFRDPTELDAYLEHSNFLADINNERARKNATYKAHLSSLNMFAMFMFANDTISIPRESSHFAEVNSTSGKVTPLQERAIYQEDWLGLRILDEQDKLDFRTVPGQHMQLTDDILTKAFKEFFGPTQSVLQWQGSPSLVKQGAA